MSQGERPDFQPSEMAMREMEARMAKAIGEGIKYAIQDDRNKEFLNLPAKNRSLKFDPVVNAGHILTFLGFMITILVTWTTLDKRVVVLEEGRKAQATMDSAQDQRANEKFSEIKETLNEIKRTVEKVSDKLERSK